MNFSQLDYEILEKTLVDIYSEVTKKLKLLRM